MRLISGVILLLAYNFCLSIVPAAAQSPGGFNCKTPDYEDGSCIDLRQCSHLFQLLQKNPLLQEDRIYLSRSQCGYYNRSPLVCCGPEANKPIVNPNPSRFDASRLPQPGVCGNQLSDRIIGGEVTKLDEFPWMALIQYSKPNNKKGFHCGGVLIHENYVLTASHCVNGKDLTQLRWQLSAVRLGEWDTTKDVDCEEEDNCSDPVQDIPVAELTPHENYVPTSKDQKNDIALIRLSRPAQFTDWIKPICLPVSQHLRNINFDGVALTVAGWGKTENASNSNLKLKVGVDGVPLAQCNNVYKVHSLTLGSSQLCAGGHQGFDSCRGDSGGPLMSLDQTDRLNPFWYLAGVVSFGPSPCGQAGWPGVYTRIGSHVDWILEHMH